MTIPRMVGVLLALTMVGIAVVVLRVDQLETSRRIQELQFRHVELQRQIWAQDLELARLLSPQQIRERAVRFGLVPGSEDAGSDGVGTRVSDAPARTRHGRH